MNIHDPHQQFFDQLAEHGWQTVDPAHAPPIKSPKAVRQLTHALLTYWKQNPTLDQFAELVNGGMLLNLSPSAQNEFITLMNHAYLDHQTQLPETMAECYRELVFWDQCPVKRCVDHFDQVREHFLRLLRESPIISPEIVSLIKNSNPSDQMESVRQHTIQILRDSVRGSMAAQITPLARIETLLLYATGEIGSYLVDDSLWHSALQTAIQSSRTKADVYIQLRQALLNAGNGQILDHPQITLQRLHTFLAELDRGVAYGQNLDALTMLAYWRSLHFTSIPDHDLLAIYQSFLKNHPKQAHTLSNDFETLQESGHESLLEPLEQLFVDSSANPKGDTMNGRRKDGYRGRTAKSSTEAQKIRRLLFGGLGIVAALLVLIVLMRMIPAPSTSPDLPSKEAATEEAVETKTSKPKKQPETSMPADIPEETNAAPAKTNAPTATPKPSESLDVPEEKNEPTPEPILDEPIIVEEEEEVIVPEVDEEDAIPVE